MFKTESAQIECDTCGRATRHQRNVRYPNHVLHLVLSLFTAGLWIPIWILASIVNEKDSWRCSLCGEIPGGPPMAFWKKIVLFIVIGIPTMILLAYLYVR